MITEEGSGLISSLYIPSREAGDGAFMLAGTVSETSRAIKMSGEG
jgi:hypothetical protein